MRTIPNLIPSDPGQIEAMHQQLLREAQEQSFVEAVQVVCGAALELADGTTAGALDLLLTAVGTLASTTEAEQRQRAAKVLRTYATHLDTP